MNGNLPNGYCTILNNASANCTDPCFGTGGTKLVPRVGAFDGCIELCAVGQQYNQLTGACRALDPETTTIDFCDPEVAFIGDDNVCTLFTECSETLEYEFKSPTPSSDRSCSALLNCNDTHFETTAPTVTSDRGCTEYRACSSLEGLYIAINGTATTDRVCGACNCAHIPGHKNDTACEDSNAPVCVTCDKHQYSIDGINCIDHQGFSAACSGDDRYQARDASNTGPDLLDEVCPLCRTVCPAGYRFVAECNETVDTQCTPCAPGTYLPIAAIEAECLLKTICSDGVENEGGITEDRTCKTKTDLRMILTLVFSSVYAAGAVAYFNRKVVLQ
mgnify:CR=1 FL=1